MMLFKNFVSFKNICRHGKPRESKKKKKLRLVLTEKFKHGWAKSIILIICMLFHMRFWYRPPLDLHYTFSLKGNIWNVELHSVQDFLNKKMGRKLQRRTWRGK